MSELGGRALIYYHGPHILWNIAGEPQVILLKNLTLVFLRKTTRENFKDQEMLLTYGLRVCWSWSFILTRCCVLTWVTKLLMRDLLNVHGGCIWPAGRRYPSVINKEIAFDRIWRENWSRTVTFPRHLK